MIYLPNTLTIYILVTWIEREKLTRERGERGDAKLTADIEKGKFTTDIERGKLTTAIKRGEACHIY